MKTMARYGKWLLPVLPALAGCEQSPDPMAQLSEFLRVSIVRHAGPMVAGPEPIDEDSVHVLSAPAEATPPENAAPPPPPPPPANPARDNVMAMADSMNEIAAALEGLSEENAAARLVSLQEAVQRMRQVLARAAELPQQELKQVEKDGSVRARMGAAEARVNAAIEAVSSQSPALLKQVMTCLSGISFAHE